MNYNSVQEIIDAGITNMTCLRNNSKQDDGTDTVTVADWLTFNGVAVSTIYVSGNTWMGFGSSTEHLKINTRDSVMYYLYHEEGTLNGCYNFIKIRWSGFTAYNKTTDDYKLTCDVILFDTGDIMVHLVDWPLNNNGGTYNLVADVIYNYTLNSIQPDVTFYKQESGSYTVKNEIAVIQASFNKKYLIKNHTSDGYELLTVDAYGLFQTLDTTEITAATFQNYGFDEVPSSDLLVTLSKFDVLLWNSNAEELPTLTAEVAATPSAQTVVTDLIDISDYSISGVETITATATGSPLFALSFDGKQSWEAWTGTAWATLDSDVSGMTGDMMASIAVDQWAVKVAGLTGFHLKFILHDGDTVESIVVDFLN